MREAELNQQICGDILIYQRKNPSARGVFPYAVVVEELLDVELEVDVDVDVELLVDVEDDEDDVEEDVDVDEEVDDEVDVELLVDVEELVVVKLKFITSICPNRNSDILLKFGNGNFRAAIRITCLRNCPTPHCNPISYRYDPNGIRWNYDMVSYIICWSGESSVYIFP